MGSFDSNAAECGIITTEMGNVPSARHRAEDTFGFRRARGVVHRGDAVPDQLPSARRDVLGPSVGIGVGRERARLHLTPCPLDEQAGRLAVGAAPDLASGRIARVAADPERVERRRADDRFVQAVVHDDDRAIDARGIEVVPGRREAGARVVPSDTANPVDLGLGRRLRADLGNERVAIRRGADIAPAGCNAAIDR